MRADPGGGHAAGARAQLLAAVDPANPYGGVLPWPDTAGRPARSAAALVVLRAGEPLVWFERRGHHLVTFPGAATDPSWAEALVAVVKDGRARAVEVRKVDGARLASDDVPGSVLDALRAAGFVDGYRGLVYRA